MYFDEVKKNFGFGCMRLPMIENGKAVDIEQTKKDGRYIYRAGLQLF